MKNSKKFISGIVAALMITATSAVPSFAASAPTEDGKYTANIVMNKDGEQTQSMAGVLFAPTADITISGENATIDFYVADPIPAFVGEEHDYSAGTVKDVSTTIDSTKYDATSTLKNTTKTFAQTNAMFGITSGEDYTCDTLSLTVPKTALSNAYLDISAYVCVVMTSNVAFDMYLSNYEAVGSTPENTPETKTMEITATVPENTSTYSVTIPESTDIGTLSYTQPTTKTYDVTVDLGNDGKTVTVSTESSMLTDGTNTINVSNSFGTELSENFTESKTVTGTLTVDQLDESAVIGNYTGTIAFEISVDK